jgi:hypothetical protein
MQRVIQHWEYERWLAAYKHHVRLSMDGIILLLGKAINGWR